MRSSQVCPSIVRIGHLYILHHHHPIYPYDDDTSPLTIPSSYPVSVPSTTSNHRTLINHGKLPQTSQAVEASPL